MGRVIVVGSINQDITVTVDRLPQPGETLSGTSTTYRLGGKGANQAVMAARLGAQVSMVTKLGRDPFGTGLGSELLVNVWGYCFGSPFFKGALPKGLLHPRRIRPIGKHIPPAGKPPIHESC